MAYTVFLVEDNQDLNSILQKYLENAGYTVEVFLDGFCAQQKIRETPDLWILDIMLPDTTGYTLFKEIKAIHPDIPVIFISAKNQEIDRVVGLELGCDDYISKPFLPRELILKTQKLLERKNGTKPHRHAINKINDYTIHRENHTIHHEGVSISLTSKEFELLLFFIDHPNRVFSREQILERLWDKNYYGSDRVVDDTVRRIRKKMPKLSIETVYGYGYRYRLVNG
ncbi:response regulator transcription factor [Brevibacillus agri]|uniref:response regulator transcription factor n=1 Tax=Brevibacillus agri TaxID=51101 RepID=UPI001C8EE523|nr:response regulator transcription factor [Brevibacillus agri]MBY0053388.1 response regulator transcription factor [Brevibacillus agri]